MVGVRHLFQLLSTTHMFFFVFFSLIIKINILNKSQINHVFECLLDLIALIAADLRDQVECKTGYWCLACGWASLLPPHSSRTYQHRFQRCKGQLGPHAVNHITVLLPPLLCNPLSQLFMVRCSFPSKPPCCTMEVYTSGVKLAFSTWRIYERCNTH